MLMQFIATILYLLAAWFWACTAKMSYSKIDFGTMDNIEDTDSSNHHELIFKNKIEVLCPFLLKDLNKFDYEKLTSKYNYLAAVFTATAICFDRLLPLLCDCN